MRMRANKNRNFPRFLISGNKSGMVEIKKSIGKTKTRSRLGSATSPTHRFSHVKKEIYAAAKQRSLSTVECAYCRARDTY